MFKNNDKYLNRDLSWLEFNARVLDEAADRLSPLLERLKFISIFSSNLDEFYMVRVAGVSRQLHTGKIKVYKGSGYFPHELMSAIDRRVRTLTARQHRFLYGEILPALEKEGVKLSSWDSLPPALRDNMRRIFLEKIFPVLTPIGIDSFHPFPLIPNLGLELLIRLRKPGETHDRFAVMEVPSGLPRFMEVESNGRAHTFITLENLISNNLDSLFGGFELRECSAFRITRDMDFSIDEESVADLLTEIQVALQKNAKRNIVRLEIASAMKPSSRAWLLRMLGVGSETVFPCAEEINLKSFFELSGIDRPDLRNEELTPLPSIHIPRDKTIFETIREQGSFLMHHPFESFDPVVRFLDEAASDPDVLAIKQTLYRVSGNSPVVKALIRAALNGKQVSVLVELKARFDEENNINWARELDAAGAHVVYGVANLKVHCKVLLVVRRESNGIQRYMHLGTGNYNDKTARLYTDLGMFTNDRAIASDVSSLFNVITGFSTPPSWNKLLVAPFNMLDHLIFLIDREAGLSTAQNPGSIRMKVNSMIDYEVISHLYDAARKNVKIELVVRGICGINPFSLPEKYRKNISVVSIIDRFLEHSRIYRFGNNGSPEYYLGSADVMQRNLRRRIEVLFPVEKPESRAELDFILDCELNDRRKGRGLIGKGIYSRTYTGTAAFAESQSQLKIYRYYKERYKKFRAAKHDTSGMLTVFNAPKNS